MGTPKAFQKRPEDGSLTPAVAGWLDLIWQLIKSDVYTPTLTNVTNISASNAVECPYIRVGNIVIVGIRFAANTIAGASTDTELGISLPIPSVFTSVHTDAMGSVSTSAIQQSGRVLSDVTNNRLSVQWSATDSGDRAWGGLAMYLIK